MKFQEHSSNGSCLWSKSEASFMLSKRIALFYLSDTSSHSLYIFSFVYDIFIRTRYPHMMSGVKTMFYFQNQISIIRCSCHSLFQDVISAGRVSVLKLKFSSRRRVLHKPLFSKRFSPIITVILFHIPGLVIPVAAVDTENKCGKGSNYRMKFLFFH